MRFFFTYFPVKFSADMGNPSYVAVIVAFLMIDIQKQTKNDIKYLKKSIIKSDTQLYKYLNHFFTY